MSDKNKVIWSEGLFLRPQHLQQQERYIERFIEGRAGQLLRHSWGCLELEIDRELLSISKLALRRVRGVFPDGTPFAMPDNDALPSPLEVGADVRDRTAYLALSVRKVDALDVSRDPMADTLVRHTLREWEARDVTRESSDRVPLEVGCVRAQILLEGTPLEDFACIPIARIRECRADRQVVMDTGFMPTVLDIGACPPVDGYLNELLGMVKQHADSLGQLVVGVRAGAVAEIADLMRLAALNRAEPLLQHLRAVWPVHPEDLYLAMLALAGELATLVQQDRRVPELPRYVHGSLRTSFEPLMQLLRSYLSDAGPSRATALEVEQMRPSLYRVKLPDPTLLDGAAFYLAAKATMPADALRRSFAASCTIAPVLRLQEYVEGQWAGIQAEPLAMLPPSIPFYADYVYYELNRAHQTWPELRGSGAFGIHVAGQFPDLAMKMWAVRQ